MANGDNVGNRAEGPREGGFAGSDVRKAREMAQEMGDSSANRLHMAQEGVAVERFDFGSALRAMKHGARVQRDGWNGKGMWIALQRPDYNSKMSLPYLYMKTADEKLVPWLASQSDMLADDWRLTL